MGKPGKQCPHSTTVERFLQEHFLSFKQGHCQECDAKGSSLWLCLEVGCRYVGCGESVSDHSSEHSESANHKLTINLLSQRTWCNVCDCEVFPDVIIKTKASMVADHPPPGGRRQISIQGGQERITHPHQQHHHHGNSEEEEMEHSGAAAAPEYYPQIPSFRTVNTPVTQALDEIARDETKPRGLTGLRNLGNTCYLNAGIQALSNCPAFAHFFLECNGFVKTEKKPYLAASYQRLMEDIWGRRRPSYLTPSSLVNSVKAVFPMFKGFTQQDSQEFLRCIMDRLHEELKEPVYPEPEDDDDTDGDTVKDNPEKDQQQTATRRRNRAPSPSLDTSSYHRTRSNDSLSITEEMETTGSLPPDNDHYNASQSQEDAADERTSLQHHGASSAGGEEPRGHGVDKNHPHRKRTTDSFSETEPLHPNPVPRVTSRTRTTSSSSTKYDREVYDSEKDIDEMASGDQGMNNSREHAKKKKQPLRYRSIISDVFDGKILSSVQCLTCENISCQKETFQDLSLPIPGKEDLARIQGMLNKSTVSCADTRKTGWMTWLYSYWHLPVSWFWGPNVTLDNCLAAFFSADELKGDNMYSCEKCKKLRNGVKFVHVLELPEVLCIHLKRFRHESFTSYCSKLNNYVSFPLDSLDMTPYLSKDCKNKCATYDLSAVICHHGTAGGGHYTSYAVNWLNGQWYEYDDIYVTEVSTMQVANCEAYVLFYKKTSEEANKERQRVIDLFEQEEPSFLHFYVSLQWLNKLNNFAEPGPITNHDFLCKHGGVQPRKASYVEKLVLKIPQPVWDHLYQTFGGGPAVNRLSPCSVCQAEMELLERRRKEEMETFITMNEEFQQDESTNSSVYCISLAWFKQWEAFVKAKQAEPPGLIDNKLIAVTKGGYTTLKQGADSGQISEAMWEYLHGIYDGGPEVVLRPNPAPSVEGRGEEGAPTGSNSPREETS
ncbi:ubiquitin carboxyl-terminal hydrolase 20 [Strongylocentrotus purpuratus]|uniref:Ubiquitin carboxyl-terminal hydrolase n=1 Tax=Strongylocentrotus purpuratus TaxID=7668 RepID=A0A7M7PPH2_STRPU|nr:ubiquitin carboxyl-terminal hydrolase 20 [Strongylocentrotus purpuratus]